MRNVTITMDEKVAKWARVWAARHETSLSRLVGELLREKMTEDRGYEIAMRQFLDRGPALLKTSGRYPSRDKLHDRQLLR